MENFIILSPIENFETDMDTIDLDTGLSIRKFSEEEIKALYESVNNIDKFAEINSFGFSYKFSEEQANFKTQSTIFNHIIYLTERVISNLRLFKEGNVGIKLISLFWLNNNKINLKMSRYASQHHFYNPKYILSKSESEEFNKLKHIFNNTKVSDSGFWTLAKSRLESSYGGRKLDDKLIDFTIGLEALFSEGPGDLTFKLSNRTARLLGKTKEERIKISIAMKKIYDFRSKIVHGEMSKDPDFEANVNRAEKYLRESLKRFLELISKHGENKDELIRIIDFEM